MTNKKQPNLLRPSLLCLLKCPLKCPFKCPFKCHLPIPKLAHIRTSARTRTPTTSSQWFWQNIFSELANSGSLSFSMIINNMKILEYFLIFIKLFLGIKLARLWKRVIYQTFFDFQPRNFGGEVVVGFMRGIKTSLSVFKKFDKNRSSIHFHASCRISNRIVSPLLCKSQ